MAASQKERSTRIQESLQTRERAPLADFDSRKYVQHNLLLGDGLGPLLAFMDGLPADRTKVTVLRALEDGEYSILHAEYELGDWGPMVGFEIHRWEDDRIVEHWDALFPTPAGTNASGRSMTDGPTEVLDVARTDANKQTVDAFTREVLIDGVWPSAPAYFSDGALLQHSPRCGDGARAFEELTRAERASGGAAYHGRRLLLGEGDMVLTGCEGTLRGEPAAFYDLYRLADGRIAEHWEIFETIPARENWENDNGKF